MTSCHHGHFTKQNNLKAAEHVLKTHKDEIDVMEIDFVHLDNDFVSSHDYNTENIKNGSPLLEWIKLVVLKYKKTLWIDLKSHVDFIAFFCSDVRFKLDCRKFFEVLNGIRHKLKLRIETHIWISCQDREVHDCLVHQNLNTRWKIVNDIPFVYSYVCKYLLPLSAYPYIHDYVFKYFLVYDFGDDSEIICIDQSFFPSTTKLLQFIEASNIPLGATIVLYTFKREQQVQLHLNGYNIIMQYDYAPKPAIISNKHK
jgi:hypothetical protein